MSEFEVLLANFNAIFTFKEFFFSTINTEKILINASLPVNNNQTEYNKKTKTRTSECKPTKP